MQSIIIRLMVIIIIAYSIFAYSYIFDPVEIISYKIKMADAQLNTTSFTNATDNGPNNGTDNGTDNGEQSNQYKRGDVMGLDQLWINWIYTPFSDILKTVLMGISTSLIKMENLRQFIQNVRDDFFIYV
jgi:hypothetical protein